MNMKEKHVYLLIGIMSFILIVFGLALCVILPSYAVKLFDIKSYSTLIAVSVFVYLTAIPYFLTILFINLTLINAYKNGLMHTLNAKYLNRIAWLTLTDVVIYFLFMLIIFFMRRINIAVFMAMISIIIIGLMIITVSGIGAYLIAEAAKLKEE